MQSLSLEAQKILDLAGGLLDDNPGEYIMECTQTKKMPLNLPALIKRILADLDHLDWIMDEGYFTGRDFEQFKDVLRKNINKKNAAIEELNRISRPKTSWYSVLLLYPDYLATNGPETYYDFVQATSPEDVLEEVRTWACDANPGAVEDPTDFLCLGVFLGKNDLLLNFATE